MKKSKITDKQSSPAGISPRRFQGRRWVILAIVLTLALAIAYFLAIGKGEGQQSTEAHYVGRSVCIDCHQDQAQLFANSHHNLAMNRATPETVLARFDGTTIEHYGLQSRVFMDGDKYMVTTEGPDGSMRDFEVKYVFGVTPLQQYMVEIEPPADPSQPGLGRVQILRESWDALNERWFYLNPPDVDEKLDPSDPLHWTGLTQSWNTFCADCHSTNLQKNFDFKSAHFQTTFSEIDVSCEACHGPGSQHVEWAKSSWASWNKPEGLGLNQLKSADHVRQVETCAPCHSRRTKLGDTWIAGEPYDQNFSVQLLEHPIYHRDGQVRDENYVYGSFIQSKMYASGIRCTDCHDPHSLRVRYNDNQLCTSCHQHPAAKYDTPEHHHHAPGSPGSQCVECHMPHTTYMEVDARRDHSLRAPRPDMSVKFGTPNACTACHIDKTKLPAEEQPKLRQFVDWIIQAEQGNSLVAEELKKVDQAMSDAFVKWYGAQPHPARTTYYHDLAELLSSTENRAMLARPLVEDLTLPTMIRASALLHLGTDSSPESLRLARVALRGRDSKMIRGALPRIEHELLLRQQSVDQNFIELLTEVVGLLDHESPAVKSESTRVLLRIPDTLRRKNRVTDFAKKWETAVAEWRAILWTQSDWPQSHLMLGDLYADEGNQIAAIESYETAIKVGPNLVGPRTNLAAILEGLLQEKKSRLADGRNLSPQDRSLLTEDIARSENKIRDLRDAEHQLLADEIKRSGGLPNADALNYRFAMSCFLRGDLEGCERHLLKSFELQPQNVSTLFALIAYYQEARQSEQAKVYAEKLLELDPADRTYQQILREQESKH